MLSFLRKHWPVWASLIILWVIILILLWLVAGLNNGHLVYTLDDAYIHLAIAKNLSQRGVWGVSQYSFSSASSSLLWTLLLAGCNGLFGVSDLTPLILNIIFSLGLVVLVYGFLKLYIKNNLFIFIILLLVIFATPLPALIFSGMEHVLHIILALAFLFLAVNILMGESWWKYERQLLLIITPLLAAVRYEGLILIAVIAGLFWFKKQHSFAGAIIVLALLPLVIFGLVSVAHGWYFLPNSILLKSNLLVWSSNFGNYHNFFSFFKALYLFGDHETKLHLFCLMFLSLIMIFYQSFLPRTKSTQTITTYNFIFFLMAILSLPFSRWGWFYRYEAYLLAMGLVAAGISLASIFKFLYRGRSKIKIILDTLIYLLLVVILVNSIWRAVMSFALMPIATTNIYQQQYQMGLFVKKFYSGHGVAINDIGAVEYLAEPRLTDLAGLANIEIARLQLQKRYSTLQIDVLTKKNQVEMAMIYDSWFMDKGTSTLPVSWIKVGQWKINHNVVCGDDTVSFYAISPPAKDSLMNNLKNFARDLPSAVQQSGLYLQH